jgi:hypothetical protein
VSAILAIRAGLIDAREGRLPYFWVLAFNADDRGQLLRQGWKDMGKIYVIAVILDVVYQLIALHTVYPGEALLVGCLLAVIPYVFIRVPVTRIASHRREQP